MLQARRWLLNSISYYLVPALLPLAIAAPSLMVAQPAGAEQVIIQSGNGFYYQNPTTGFYQQSPPTASYIYGSPIPTPMPVNPYTGLLPSQSSCLYGCGRSYSYPIRNGYCITCDDAVTGEVTGEVPFRRSRVENSTLINPTVINSTIRNSTLINPVIVNPSRYSTPYHHHRYSGRSPNVIVLPGFPYSSPFR